MLAQLRARGGAWPIRVVKRRNSQSAAGAVPQKSTRQTESAVYIALVDPEGRAVLRPGAREVFAEHGYRLWDISPLMTAAAH